MLFNKLGFGLAAVTFALVGAQAANAATFNVGDPNFQITSGDPFSPTISAAFFNGFSTATTFDDIFEFTIPQNGFGSGSISTSFSGEPTQLVITDLIINGTSYAIPPSGAGQSAIVGGIPIISGVLNTIQVKGFTLGSGTYAGTATFTAAIPEPTTWALMIGGFGLVGASMRRRRMTVSFA